MLSIPTHSIISNQLAQNYTLGRDRVYEQWEETVVSPKDGSTTYFQSLLNFFNMPKLIPDTLLQYMPAQAAPAPLRN